MLFLNLFLMNLVFFNSIQAQQFYDKSDCSETTKNPGSRYTCNISYSTCSTFLVYRSNSNFNTISNISRLFRKDTEELLRVNDLPSPSESLKPGTEILIPVICSCKNNFFQVNNFTYMVYERTTLSEIACSVFEGLVKSNTLFESNPSQENYINVGSELVVPLKCACPDSNSKIMYFITYPLIEGDSPSVITKKFGIFSVDLWLANNLEPNLPTIYPNTTILIPLKKFPVINFNNSNYYSPPPAPDFLPTITVKNRINNPKLINLYISVSVVGFFLISTTIIACGWYAKKVLFKRKIENLQSFNTRSSATPVLSPDLLVGVKYYLKSYCLDDLKIATRDFDEENKIGNRVYKGLIDDNIEIMIKQMRFEETRRVIDVHSRINHINIVSLIGVCNGDEDDSYLVFDLPSNGSLRDCLSNKLSSSPRWHRRVQIAFDIATALHYLHNCIFPSYAHMCVNTRNIYLTQNWRAKLTNITINSGAEPTNNEGWVAPEHILYGAVSDKVDIFAFGVVLLEIISGKEDFDGALFKDCIRFLGGGSGSELGGCFEQLKRFIDPNLKDDYRLAEALCLSVLAKACVEDEPLHRPSMDDILKVLVRLV
ncbi:lysM domain receptor-like kinase 4 [Mercurialis annua]|uniref:lysM domain receptor-like kinase 4 n=1 Tax=Mercurialis annua TaxID=3986 RepID=UPI002160CFBF|nr:lysM domain receptor-like kinase 4 [Mercurialis annua]